MTISELKKDAKVKLAGNYKKAIAISLLYYFIVIIIVGPVETVEN